MKRREAKFVHASPRLEPDQLGAAPRVRETKARQAGNGIPSRAVRAAASKIQRLARPKRWADEGVNAMVNADAGDTQPRCPMCGLPLIGIGGLEIGISEGDARRRHTYCCPAGCRGPEPDGMFEFIECPVCGSHDTVSTPRGDGVEELECNSCDTITTLQILPLRL